MKKDKIYLYQFDYVKEMKNGFYFGFGENKVFSSDHCLIERRSIKEEIGTNCCEKDVCNFFLVKYFKEYEFHKFQGNSIYLFTNWKYEHEAFKDDEEDSYSLYFPASLGDVFIEIEKFVKETI